jgi:hypothetical protein
MIMEPGLIQGHHPRVSEHFTMPDGLRTAAAAKTKQGIVDEGDLLRRPRPAKDTLRGQQGYSHCDNGNQQIRPP